MTFNLDDTTVARPSSGGCRVTLLTPPGRSAVATVALAGPGAEALIANRFVAASGKSIEQLRLGRIVFGHWLHSADDTAREEVVVVRRQPQEVEVHCHGGTSAAESIIQGLVAAGAVPGRPEDWLREHAADSLEAEALVQLARAETERTAAILLDQSRGALRHELETIRECLCAQHTLEAAHRVDRLLAAGRVGTRLTQPWQIVFAGLPNAGKSSLANALLGFERSIVHCDPGTTRDRVEVATVLDGWPLEIVDTAGLRRAGESVEEAGIVLAYEAIAAADLVLWIHDASQVPAGPQLSQLPAEIQRQEMLWVLSKCDIASNAATPPGWIRTSSRTGQGLDSLKQAIVDRLVPLPPQPGAAVPFTAEQCRLLAAAAMALQAEDTEQADALVAAVWTAEKTNRW